MKIILIAAVIIFGAISVNAQVSVVANKSVSESSINASSLANIYTLTTTKWNNGTKVVLFDTASEDIKNSVCTFISKDALALKKEWLKKQLTGEAKAPQAISSDSEVISKVASTPGAIGFVKSSSVTGDVKILLEIK